MQKKRDVAIVAYGETKIATKTGRSAYDLASEVFEQILERTGLEPKDIDGLAVSETMSETKNPFYSVYMADLLGLTTRWNQVTGLGGCSALANIARAASAIREGYCETVLVIASDAQSSLAVPAEQGAQRFEFQYPVGLKGPVGVFGLMTQRYRHLHGLKDEALAKLAVTQRNHALLNDNACEKLRKPITERDYLESKFVSDPLRMLDSVMVCDGANGVLVTSVENAERIGAKQRVYPVAYSEITNHKGTDFTAEVTDTGFSVVGPDVLRKAGMSVKDIRMLQCYDDFLIALMLVMEGFGFCEVGQASDFVLANDFSFSGNLPLNTGGGQISAGQAGLAGGGTNLVEAVRQLFGEGGARQVPNPVNSLVTGIGQIPYGKNWGVSNAMILEQ
ncbi:thiolase family protein [Piscinibacter koreensis]|uniref:Thiolase family protein n=1 Tax=Piscinibacter koreensis TaxID=2742824 RepID=A0A7Y6NQ86_9BURK|nr:thiolase family protein [Schlegelella koreensis]NUZ07305.1 thiolase family protein [Schlegelella koreensis]